jgi:Mn2+/Fe2+ NRAMP family transporter
VKAYGSATATDIDAGARFDKLLWVILVSNMIAIYDTFRKAGIATGRDLAQNSRDLL